MQGDLADEVGGDAPTQTLEREIERCAKLDRDREREREIRQRVGVDR